MAESKGFFRRTPVHLRVALLLDHVGENSPPDCFLPQTVSAPSLFESLYLFLPKQKAGLAACFSFWQIALILIETILRGNNHSFRGCNTFLCCSPITMQGQSVLFFVGAVVDCTDVLRQLIGNHGGEFFLISVPDCLFIVPAFEFQHIQSAVHPCDLLLHMRLLRFK